MAELMKDILIALCIVFSISACAPLLTVHPLEEDDNRNNITIVRNYNHFASGYHYWPTLNGKEISGLLTKQFVTFYLPSGNSRLGVKCIGGLFPIWWHDEISINVENGNKYYFVISPYSLGCADIKQLKLDEAVEYLEGAKQIKTGFISDCEGNSVKVKESSPQLCLFRMP